MDRKAQAQIITTVLIILLVLAAIVIVWQVVSGTIEEGGEQVESQSNCIGLKMNVIRASNTEKTSDVLVQRGTGGAEQNVTEVRVYINGAIANDTGPLPTASELEVFDTLEVNVSSYAYLASGMEIEVSAKVGNIWCPSLDKGTVPVEP